MTWVDRLYVWLLRNAFRLVSSRVEQGKGRVWWFHIDTSKPYRLRDGTIVEKQAYLSLGYGPPGTDGNVGTIGMTRDQFDRLVEGSIEVRKLQDQQYEERRYG